MIESPERQIDQFAEAGADIITVHIEACPKIKQIVSAIKELGVKAGVALNPETPLSAITEILPSLDLVLVMTVNPGYGGQLFIESTLDKIASLRAELDRKGLDAELEVDGGINAEVAPKVVKAGARVLVAGAAVFASGQTVKEAIAKLRSAVLTSLCWVRRQRVQRFILFVLPSMVRVTGWILGSTADWCGAWSGLYYGRTSASCRIYRTSS